MQDQLKILIVDDAESDRRLVKRSIERFYHHAYVQEAKTCTEATEAMASHDFDCIFLDAWLPDGDALPCLKDMRRLGNTTPIIILSGLGDEEVALEAIQAGATEYLSKSELTPQLLKHRLRSVLRAHQSQAQIRHAHAALQLRDRAIAAASNGIVICASQEPDCPIIYSNPAFSVMTGYSSKEVMGRNCRFLQGADTDQNCIQQIRDSLREERECQVIFKNYKKDGKAFWNELTISPVRDSKGILTHYIGIQTDITLRREAEEALRINMARQQTVLRDMFSSVTHGKLTLCGSVSDLPDPYTRFAEPVSLSQTSGIRELRTYAMDACLAGGMEEERRYDLETAVGEAAMNAIVHADSGVGHVFVHERGTVQVKVEDEGSGIAVEDLPNATLQRGFSSAGTMGHGFKMILQTVDRVHLLTGATGTTVVMEQDRMAPILKW